MQSQTMLVQPGYRPHQCHDCFYLWQVWSTSWLVLAAFSLGAQVTSQPGEMTHVYCLK